MLWVVYSLFSALFQSVASVANKKIMAKEHPLEGLVASMGIGCLGVLLLYPMVDFSVSFDVLVMIFAASLLFALSLLLQFRTYREMEISQVEPLRNISPVFLGILAFIFLGESLDFFDIIGILIIAVGAYIIEVDHSFSHVIENLKVFGKKGVVRYIEAMILLSFTAIIDKFIIKFVNGITILYFGYFMTFAILFVAYFLRFRKIGIFTSLRRSHVFIAISGLFGLLSEMFYFIAITIPGTLVSLVIPIVRMSTLFATIIGGEVFHEHGVQTRIVGCIVLITGSLMVIF